MDAEMEQQEHRVRVSAKRISLLTGVLFVPGSIAIATAAWVFVLPIYGIIVLFPLLAMYITITILFASVMSFNIYPDGMHRDLLFVSQDLKWNHVTKVRGAWPCYMVLTGSIAGGFFLPSISLMTNAEEFKALVERYVPEGNPIRGVVLGS